MQLVAYGAQDIYLTGNPQITFFKVVYRRHTNFAMESIEQTFNGSVSTGKRVTATISRNGDLIKDMWLEIDLGVAPTTDATGLVYGVGNALVKQVEVEIGGQLIDRQYGEWMNIWTELSTPAGKRDVYDEMVGNQGTYSNMRQQLDVPLQFWFNRNPGLALPLIALQDHEVKLNLDIESQANVNNNGASPDIDLSNLTCKLWVDYIYLDTDERRRFAQVSHEYLIEQVQFTGDESIADTSTTKRVDLSFNHPVKELIWVHQTTKTGATQARGSGTTAEPCQFTQLSNVNTKLQLNGHDRFTERREQYFRNVQMYKHHSNGPRCNRTVMSNSTTFTDSFTDNDTGGADATETVSVTVTHLTQDNAQWIYAYSFALNPEEHQPSGTCNFSRIDNATLSLTKTTGSFVEGILKVFAVNYNVLRIMSGMGGLAYSN
jgi:hypothetical protein